MPLGADEFDLLANNNLFAPHLKHVPAGASDLQVVLVLSKT